MVTKKADYFYTDGLDGITIDGSILPLRTGAAQKVLKGEDLAFLAEALNERSLAARGEFTFPIYGDRKFPYSRAEHEWQFLDVAQGLALDRSWPRTEYSALNNATDMNEFLKLVDTSVFDSYGRLTGSKDYGPSRVDAIGATAYHHAPLTPSPQTAKIINVQDELDAYSNERKLTRFFRDYNFDFIGRLPPFTVTSTGVDDDGRPISDTHTASDGPYGICIGYQWNRGESTYHSEERPITHRYVKSGFVWRPFVTELYDVATRIYNLPPGSSGWVILRGRIINRTTYGYVERYFTGCHWYFKFAAGDLPKNTAEITFGAIFEGARVFFDVAWDSPFVHNDVAVPARRDEFDLRVSNKVTKYDCLEIYAQPIGAIIDLGDHTKWWEQ